MGLPIWLAGYLERQEKRGFPDAPWLAEGTLKRVPKRKDLLPPFGGKDLEKVRLLLWEAVLFYKAHT